MPHYIDPIADHGATFDGVTDDTAALLDAIDNMMATGRQLLIPPGWAKTTAPLVIANTGVNRYEQGPRIVAPAGPRRSGIIGTGLVNQPVLKIDGYSPNGGRYFSHTLIDGLGIRQQGCVNSDAIQYHSTWHTQFSDLHIEGASGKGVHAHNPPYGIGYEIGDANASSLVKFSNIRIEDCAGPAWSCAGSNGGIANHVFDTCYFFNNAYASGPAQVDIDGLLHSSFHMMSIAAHNWPHQPERHNLPVSLVKIRSSTGVMPDNIQFTNGEFGNASGTHFDVDMVNGLYVNNTRHVRRFGETAARYVFYFRTETGSVSGVQVPHTRFVIDNVASDGVPMTWMRRAGGYPLRHTNIVYAPDMAEAPGASAYEGFY